MRTNTRALFAAAMAFLLVVACGDDGGGILGSPSEPAGDASGLSLHQGDGFSMLMPDDWTIVATEDMDLEELFGSVAASVDSEALARQVLDMFAQGGKLFAFDFERASGQFIDNINILTAPRPPGGTAEELEAVSLEQFRLILGATNLSSEIVAAPAGEAVVIRYRLSDQATEGISATIITPSSHWAITLSATDAGPLDTMFMTMIDSFRETP